MLVTLLLALGVVAVAAPWGAATLAALARLAAALEPAAPEPAPPVPVTVLTLVGLATLSAGAALWSLAGGIGGWAFGLAVAGALALAVRAPARAALAASLRRERAVLAAAGGLAALALALGGLLALGRAASPVENYDTGAYHAQVVRWLEAHGMVPGLGNLHSRLAMSAGWFTASALFSLAWLGGRSFHVLNALLFLLVLLMAAEGFAEWRAGRRGGGALLRMSFPAAGLFLFGPWLSSPSPDVSVAFLTWMAGVLVLEGADRGDLAGPPGWRVLAIAVLAGFAVGIKLSALPLALLPLYFAVRLLRSGRRRAAFALAAATAAAVLPFVAQTVAGSGYLVFPLPAVDVFPVDWKVPGDLTAVTLAWIEGWARVPHRQASEVLTMPRSVWMPLWWAHQKWFVQGAILAVLLLVPLRLGAGLVRLVREGGRPDLDRLALPLAAFLGVAFWFFGAPDPRFGWGFLMLFLLLLALPPLAPRLAERGAGRLAAALGVFFLWYAWEIHGWEPGAFEVAAAHSLVPADYPVPETRRVALGGFDAQVPVHRDQCWYEPFPCTPFPDPRITLRGQGFAQGFRMAARPQEASP